MSPYIFVIAVLVAIVPILVLFKISMERIKENPEQINRVQTQFFIGVGLSEIIPIILIVFGFKKLVPVSTIEELFIPAMIIVLMVGFASLFIFLQRTFDVEKDIKDIVHTFAMIGLAIANSIPLIAIVALILMIP